MGATVMLWCAAGRAQDAQSDMLAMSLADTNSAAVEPAPRTFWLSYGIEHGPKKYLEWLWKDPVNLFTRPFFWRAGDWETFGIEGGITGAIMPADEEIRDFVQRNREEGVSHTLKAINDYYGSVDLIWGGAGVFVIGLKLQLPIWPEFLH